MPGPIKKLQDAEQPDLFVILGTASAGLDHVFAVTDKDFETPLGVVTADQPILSQLKASLPTFFEDDLCHQDGAGRGISAPVSSGHRGEQEALYHRSDLECLLRVEPGRSDCSPFG